MTAEKRTIPSPPAILAGLGAISLSIYFLISGNRELPILIASAFFLLVCLTDTVWGKIPNLLNLGLLLAGLAHQSLDAGIQGFFLALLGAVVGLALFVIPYALGGMGAGDVKALAALGALTGPAGIFQVFLYTALLGGVLAILHYCFTHNLANKCAAGLSALRAYLYTRDFGSLKPDPQRERQRFPYAPAIALGFFAFVHWGPVVSLLLPPS